MPQVNFTGRKRIARRRIFATLLRDSLPWQLSVRLDTTDMGIPPDAHVYVEAYRGSNSERMSLGTIASAGGDSSHVLQFLTGEPNIDLRVIVVEPKRGGRLLASAEGVPIGAPGPNPKKRLPLLDPELVDTRPLAWWLDFDGPAPRLCINKNLGGWDQALRNPQVRALMFPAIIERIMLEIQTNPPSPEELSSSDDESWKKQWLQFIKQVTGTEPKDMLSAASSDFDRIVNAFARKYARIGKTVLGDSLG